MFFEWTWSCSSPEHNLVLKACKELWLQPLCTALTSSGGDCILHLCSGEFAAASHGAGPIQSLRLEWDDQGIPNHCPPICTHLRFDKLPHHAPPNLTCIIRNDWSLKHRVMKNVVWWLLNAVVWLDVCLWIRSALLVLPPFFMDLARASWFQLSHHERWIPWWNWHHSTMHVGYLADTGALFKALALLHAKVSICIPAPLKRKRAPWFDFVSDVALHRHSLGAEVTLQEYRVTQAKQCQAYIYVHYFTFLMVVQVQP